MFNKLVEWVEAKFGIDINEKHFIWGIAPLIGLLIYLVISGGTATFGNILAMLAGVGFNIFVYLSTVFGFKFFLMGKFDIQEEIKKGNIALAIYMLGLLIGLAIVVAKGIM